MITRLLIPLAILVTAIVKAEPQIPVIDVRDAVQPEVFRLSPRWQGELIRVIPQASEPPKKAVSFTHYVRDANAHAETDAPRPHLPAIFHMTVGADGAQEIGETALYATMHQDWPSLWNSFGDVMDYLPGVILCYDEEATTEVGYWFNSFMVSRGEGEMEVFFVSFVGPRNRDDRKFPIKNLEVWQGILKPSRTTASSQPSSAGAPEGGSR
jgi:hypothetical protein